MQVNVPYGIYTHRRLRTDYPSTNFSQSLRYPAEEIHEYLAILMAHSKGSDQPRGYAVLSETSLAEYVIQYILSCYNINVFVIHSKL